MSGLAARLGAFLIGLSEVTGGLFLFGLVVLRAARRPRLDAYETWRIFYRVGVKSLPIVATTAAFSGAIAVIQAGPNVMKFRAFEIIGWAFGYSVFREIGPLLIGLMFSGRVGANNTAELGTMQVTEQIDALRALAINPINYLVLPRILAMVVMMTLLNVVGDVFALAGGIGTSWLLIGVDPYVFWNSFVEYVTLTDFFNGVCKSAAFGGSIGIVSCHFGLNVKGGAMGVGRAVNACVVASAVSIFVLDYFITYLLR
ncbi:MAG: ABC transporter permease [Myxococcales bacterium]|nr:ABC transporter permease [Myxococcales bacterium]